MGGACVRVFGVRVCMHMCLHVCVLVPCVHALLFLPLYVDAYKCLLVWACMCDSAGSHSPRGGPTVTSTLTTTQIPTPTPKSRASPRRDALR